MDLDIHHEENRRMIGCPGVKESELDWHPAWMNPTHLICIPHCSWQEDASATVFVLSF